MTEISFKEKIALSTLKFNARVLREFGLIEFNGFVKLTDFGSSIANLLGAVVQLGKTRDLGCSQTSSAYASETSFAARRKSRNLGSNPGGPSQPINIINNKKGE